MSSYSFKIISGAGKCHAFIPLTEFPLEVTETAEGSSDELAVLALDVLQNVLPVCADGIRDVKWTVQLS